MNFTRYIIVSILSHLLFIGFLWIIYSTSEIKATVYDVNLVGPVEIRKQPVPQKIKPVIKKRKPHIVRRRRRPPEKKLLPETMLGEGTGLPQQGIKNSSSSEPSSKAPHAFLFDKKTIEKFARKGSPTTKKGLTFDTSEFKHRGYMKMLKERIESSWKYPKEAARLGISGDLHMKFSIKKDGKLGGIELLRTSGYRYLDEAAIKALKDAEPFWPLPEDWEKDSLEIEGHFIYIFGGTYIM